MAQPNQELVAGLREEVIQYKTVDDQLRALNGQIYPLREQRKLIEDRIVDIIRQPGFAAINELAISQDGSKIRIRKPQTWCAPWSLSKRSLHAHLLHYWSDPNTVKSSDACYRFIVSAVEATMRKDSYAIERVIPGAD
jgi:hypothetical protein